MTAHRYLGRLPLKAALLEQTQIWTRIVERRSSGEVLGFECDPVVTLGVRAQALDIVNPDLSVHGFSVERVDRGGQATLHNPGQLVIFPVLEVRALGAKAWVCRLIKATQTMAEELGVPLRWDPANPGLYNGKGKVVSLGVRMRNGISTHGLAINIHNDLAPFSWIRACGREAAPMAHLPTKYSLSEVFVRWLHAYDTEVDKASKLAQFRDLTTDVRL